jgi:Uma2 family endonuclease
VLSPRTRKVDLGVKARRYLDCGVREYWVIDPRERTIILFVATRDADGELLWERDESPILVSRLLPGFALETLDFFPGG